MCIKQTEAKVDNKQGWCHRSGSTASLVTGRWDGRAWPRAIGGSKLEAGSAARRTACLPALALALADIRHGGRTPAVRFAGRAPTLNKVGCRSGVQITG